MSLFMVNNSIYPKDEPKEYVPKISAKGLICKMNGETPLITLPKIEIKPHGMMHTQFKQLM